MGKVLYDYYVKAGTIGGIKARTKLSLLTKTSSLQAKSLVDSEENINYFDKAISKLEEEFKETPEKLEILNDKKSDTASTHLRKYLDAFVDLASQRALFIHDFEKSLKRITEAVSYAVELERVSVWFLNEEKTLLICKDLFSNKNGLHAKGITLDVKDFPDYFKAIKSEKTLPAHDVFADPRTAEFIDAYLKPLGINSMMDVPIWLKGKMVGVLCFEHTGPKRQWTADEENFAYIMSNIISMLMEKK